jgi:hypothetical protein
MGYHRGLLSADGGGSAWLLDPRARTPRVHLINDPGLLRQLAESDVQCMLLDAELVRMEREPLATGLPPNPEWGSTCAEVGGIVAFDVLHLTLRQHDGMNLGAPACYHLPFQARLSRLGWLGRQENHGTWAADKLSPADILPLAGQQIFLACKPWTPITKHLHRLPGPTLRGGTPAWRVSMPHMSPYLVPMDGFVLARSDCPGASGAWAVAPPPTDGGVSPCSWETMLSRLVAESPPAPPLQTKDKGPRSLSESILAVVKVKPDPTADLQIGEQEVGVGQGPRCFLLSAVDSTGGLVAAGACVAPVWVHAHETGEIPEVPVVLECSVGLVEDGVQMWIAIQHRADKVAPNHINTVRSTLRAHALVSTLGIDRIIAAVAQPPLV